MKKIFILISIFYGLDALSAEMKIKAEENYLEMTTERLNNLKDIFDKTHLNNRDLQSLILDYLINYKCINSFDYDAKHVNQICSLPNDDLAISYGGKFLIRDINGNIKKEIKGISMIAHLICPLSESMVATGSWNTDIQIWNIKTGECLKNFSHELDGSHMVMGTQINCLCALTKNRLASASMDSIQIWDIRTGKCLHNLVDPTLSIKSLCLLENEILASAGQDNKVRIWDIQSYKCLQEIADVGSILQLLPNDKIASVYDNVIKIWDSNFGECLQTLEGHTTQINALCLLSNNLLVSGSQDGIIKIWNSSGNCVQTLKGFEDQIVCLCPLSDGKFASCRYYLPQSAEEPIGSQKIIQIWAPTF